MTALRKTHSAEFSLRQLSLSDGLFRVCSSRQDLLRLDGPVKKVLSGELKII